MYVDLISSESVHGDAWVARIRAEHERLGPKCPCGNYGRVTVHERKPSCGPFGTRCGLDHAEKQG